MAGGRISEKPLRYRGVPLFQSCPSSAITSHKPLVTSNQASSRIVRCCLGVVHYVRDLTQCFVYVDRNGKIRQAVEAITPVPCSSNQQAIRVIREEVDRIEWALTEIIPR